MPSRLAVRCQHFNSIVEQTAKIAGLWGLTAKLTQKKTPKEKQHLQGGIKPESSTSSWYRGLHQLCVSMRVHTQDIKFGQRLSITQLSASPEHVEDETSSAVQLSLQPHSLGCPLGPNSISFAPALEPLPIYHQLVHLLYSDRHLQGLNASQSHPGLQRHLLPVASPVPSACCQPDHQLMAAAGP